MAKGSGPKRISLRKSKDFKGKYEVVVPGKKTKTFQSKTGAKTYKDANVKVKRARKQRERRARGRR